MAQFANLIGMTHGRWSSLMTDHTTRLTRREIELGWHWCPDWDGLPIGPGMAELQACRCTEPHVVRARQSENNP